MAILEVKNLTKNFGKIQVLKGIDFSLEHGQVLSVLGSSGSGKTTMLNVIGGLDGIDGGEILIQDKQFSTFTAKEYDSYRNTFHSSIRVLSFNANITNFSYRCSKI